MDLGSVALQSPQSILPATFCLDCGKDGSSPPLTRLWRNRRRGDDESHTEPQMTKDWSPSGLFFHPKEEQSVRGAVSCRLQGQRVLARPPFAYRHRVVQHDYSGERPPPLCESSELLIWPPLWLELLQPAQSSNRNLRSRLSQFHASELLWPPAG